MDHFPLIHLALLDFRISSTSDSQIDFTSASSANLALYPLSTHYDKSQGRRCLRELRSRRERQRTNTNPIGVMATQSERARDYWTRFESIAYDPDVQEHEIPQLFSGQLIMIINSNKIRLVDSAEKEFYRRRESDFSAGINLPDVYQNRLPSPSPSIRGTSTAPPPFFALSARTSPSSSTRTPVTNLSPLEPAPPAPTAPLPLTEFIPSALNAAYRATPAKRTLVEPVPSPELKKFKPISFQAHPPKAASTNTKRLEMHDEDDEVAPAPIVIDAEEVARLELEREEMVLEKANHFRDEAARVEFDRRDVEFERGHRRLVNIKINENFNIKRGRGLDRRSDYDSRADPSLPILATPSLPSPSRYASTGFPSISLGRTQKDGSYVGSFASDNRFYDLAALKKLPNVPRLILEQLPQLLIYDFPRDESNANIANYLAPDLHIGLTNGPPSSFQGYRSTYLLFLNDEDLNKCVDRHRNAPYPYPGNSAVLKMSRKQGESGKWYWSMIHTIPGIIEALQNGKLEEFMNGNGKEEIIEKKIIKEEKREESFIPSPGESARVEFGRAVNAERSGETSEGNRKIEELELKSNTEVMKGVAEAVESENAQEEEEEEEEPVWAVIPDFVI